MLEVCDRSADRLFGEFLAALLLSVLGANEQSVTNVSRGVNFGLFLQHCLEEPGDELREPTHCVTGVWALELGIRKVGLVHQPALLAGDGLNMESGIKGTGAR